jgi:hypothetical protein
MTSPPECCSRAGSYAPSRPDAHHRNGRRNSSSASSRGASGESECGANSGSVARRRDTQNASGAPGTGGMPRSMQVAYEGGNVVAAWEEARQVCRGGTQPWGPLRQPPGTGIADLRSTSATSTTTLHACWHVWPSAMLAIGRGSRRGGSDNRTLLLEDGSSTSPGPRPGPPVALGGPAWPLRQVGGSRSRGR